MLIAGGGVGRQDGWIGFAGSTTFTFEGAGNRHIKQAPTGTTTSTWNYENQRTGVVLVSGARYNGLQRQLSPHPAGGLIMVAVNYDWDELEDNIDEEYDDSGATIAEYTTEPELFGNVISQRRSGQSSFLHCDGLGSTLALTNTVGAVTDTWSYTAFGEVAEQTGSTVNPFQYVGRKEYYRNGLTGDYVMRRRWYSAALCRWLSPDPLEPKRDKEYSRYRFVMNRPTDSADPSGLQAIGISTCIPTSAGQVHFIPNRGKFATLSIDPRDVSSDWFWTRGSSFYAFWAANTRSFSAGKSCCCCGMIGFIQIARFEATWISSADPALQQKPLEQQQDWHVDAAIPYPKKSLLAPLTANPCDEWNNKIAMTDTPGIQYKLGWMPQHLRQDFELCVACLSPCVRTFMQYPEAIVYQGSFGLWWDAGITVYGCATWGHELTIDWTTNPESYSVERYINHEHRRGGLEVQFAQRNIAGNQPSGVWDRTVLAYMRSYLFDPCSVIA